jgi:hypothetical protein
MGAINNIQKNFDDPKGEIRNRTSKNMVLGHVFVLSLFIERLLS